jgi:NCAIR mutase (PurE)-related protein
MDDHDLSSLLEEVRSGTRSADEAAAILKRLPFADIGFARVDHHRALRTGMPEAVYGPGKTPEQCATVVEELLNNGTGPVLLTRASHEQVTVTLKHCPGGHQSPVQEQSADLTTLVWRPAPIREDRVLVITAGTADLPVAYEAVATLEGYGFAPAVLADCGVAGIHRLFASIDDLSGADAVIVVAGMEGALASIVGGLTAAPLVAVPTSVGYGSSLEGVTALLTMHASCSPGIVVVGIDNGFGAACAVARMLR